jgi:hypothetical protein
MGGNGRKFVAEIENLSNGLHEPTAGDVASCALLR